eukprot:CAMPEP_0196997456 /NCGR_PEP_ID=MMETSP1380-20130617/3064_1 /TAXON_ID=5936 /ORGANISM="Euplotes crassus, Strain CT5" /LENGTH=64 /DNA_ID=CAMNT_0042413695 /DNA_START=286 /DNA_END=480 /DNA_ORIENTATION=+
MSSRQGLPPKSPEHETNRLYFSKKLKTTVEEHQEALILDEDGHDSSIESAKGGNKIFRLMTKSK